MKGFEGLRGKREKPLTFDLRPLTFVLSPHLPTYTTRLSALALDFSHERSLAASASDSFVRGFRVTIAATYRLASAVSHRFSTIFDSPIVVMAGNSEGTSVDISLARLS